MEKHIRSTRAHHDAKQAYICPTIDELRPIPREMGAPSYWFACADGRIISVANFAGIGWSRGRHRGPYVLKPSTNTSGYLFIRGHRKYSRRRSFLVHRLIAAAFFGLPSSRKLEAAHIDGNKENNAESNLYWATHQQNMQDAVRHGSMKSARRRVRMAAEVIAKTLAPLVASANHQQSAPVKTRKQGVA